MLNLFYRKFVMENNNNLKYPVIIYTGPDTEEIIETKPIEFGLHKGTVTIRFNKDVCIYAEELILLLTEYTNIKDLRSLCPDVVNNKLKQLIPNVMVSKYRSTL